VTDPIGRIKDSGAHERPMSVKGVQRRAEQAQRGIEAPDERVPGAARRI
jgi:hypothetical protein